MYLCPGVYMLEGSRRSSLLVWSIVGNLLPPLRPFSHTRRNKRASLSLFAVSVEDAALLQALSVTNLRLRASVLSAARYKGVESNVPFVVPLLVANRQRYL